MIKNNKVSFYQKKLAFQIILCIFMLIIPYILYTSSIDNFGKILTLLAIVVIFLFLISYILLYILIIPKGVILTNDKIIIIRNFNNKEIQVDDINNISYDIEKDIVIHYRNKKYHFIALSKELQELLINKYSLNSYINRNQSP